MSKYGGLPIITELTKKLKIPDDWKASITTILTD